MCTTAWQKDDVEELKFAVAGREAVQHAEEIRVRVRFAFCSFGFSFTEYIHAASFSMWCVRES